MFSYLVLISIILINSSIFAMSCKDRVDNTEGSLINALEGKRPKRLIPQPDSRTGLGNSHRNYYTLGFDFLSKIKIDPDSVPYYVDFFKKTHFQSYSEMYSRDKYFYGEEEQRERIREYDSVVDRINSLMDDPVTNGDRMSRLIYDLSEAIPHRSSEVDELSDSINRKERNPGRYRKLKHYNELDPSEKYEFPTPEFLNSRIAELDQIAEEVNRLRSDPITNVDRMMVLFERADALLIKKDIPK